MLLWSLSAEAQHQPSQRDSVLLSNRIEGNDEVRSYRVDTPMEADYALHYAISSATLNQRMGDNPEELKELTDLMQTLKDTMHRVEAIHITGYASPDGPEGLNRSLARHRAENFKGYADKQYGLSKRCNVALNSEIAPWSEVRAKLAASSIEGRDEALKILDSNHTPAEKQAALKQMPIVWSYLAREVLPPLRRVEVDVKYKEGRVVETRTVIAPKPAPKPAPAPVATTRPVKRQDPCCDELLMSETLGIIVAMPDSEVDF